MNGSGAGRRCYDSDGQHGDSEGREMPSGRAEKTDMGERQDGDGRDRDRDGHRATSGAAFSICAPSVDALLAAAVRGRPEAHSEGEVRAVAAFREAWAQGKRTARTRRRDDWRPNARRRVQLSIRTTLAVLLASLTLGGAAFAAIGSAARGDNGGDRDGYGDRDRRTGTSYEVPGRPGDADRPAGDRPPKTGDTDGKSDGKTAPDTGKKQEKPAEDSGKAKEDKANKPDKAGRPAKPPHTEAEEPEKPKSANNAEETGETRPEKK
ncbi:hypothetical protein [Streptomyces tailanensis]|uniref:hypothetical protein n=1 Tax=Streptomyces tailanensis TaxID=2569858 RepID=UPI00122E6DB2|nr:hypothetical protein [Streptomyces tailanensis]